MMTTGTGTTTADAASVPDTPSEPSARNQRLLLAASKRIGSVHVVLEGLEDRGNRAAILRTVEALGLLHVHEVAAVQAEQGRARGVAHGGEKWLRVHTHATPAICRAAMAGVTLFAALPPVQELPASASWHALGGRRSRKRANNGVEAVGRVDDAPPTVAAVATVPLLEPIALDAVDFSGPVALVFGNERLGLSAEMIGVCDGAFHIPLHGLTESLNVSVAVAISLHHARLKRVEALARSDGEEPRLNTKGGDLNEAQVEALLTEYASRGKHYAKGSGRGGADADADADT